MGSNLIYSKYFDIFAKEIFCVNKNKGNPFTFICVDRQTDRHTHRQTHTQTHTHTHTLIDEQIVKQTD